MKLHTFIEKFNFDNNYPLHMPGHKRRYGRYASLDVTEIPKLDDLNDAKDIIKKLQQGYAEFYNVKKSLLSVNGSTSCILSSISALGTRYSNFLIGRASHKSVYNGVYINKIIPKYIYPKLDKDFMYDGYDYLELEDIIKKEKIEVLILTSPSYEGKILDKKKILKLKNKYNFILMIDEAHGGYLDKDYSFVDVADITVQSIHKTLPALTSTAVVHINNLDIYEEIKRYMKIYQTSSPSYILIYSMSECLEFLENDFIKFKKDVNNRICSIRKKLNNLKHLSVYLGEDIYKIVIKTNRTNLSGYELYDRLYNLGFTLEMHTKNYVIAMISLVDDFEMVDKFVDTIIEIDKGLEYRNAENINYLPRVSYKGIFKNTEHISLKDTLGRVSAEQIYVYPPGIPLLSYGEEINDEVIDIISRLNNLNYLDIEKIEVYKD